MTAPDDTRATIPTPPPVAEPLTDAELDAIEAVCCCDEVACLLAEVRRLRDEVAELRRYDCRRVIDAVAAAREERET